MVKRAFAIAAHPDDIEFMMSGTLALLGEAGYELHYMTLANGSCGTDRLSVEEIVSIRRQESMAAAARVGAAYHESLVDDIGIYYEPGTLQRVAAVVREVAPEVLLTHWPQEYMEDHSNTCRLALTAAFVRGMPNFVTAPPQPPVEQLVTVYHALPYGLHDPLRALVWPELFVDVSAVMDLKRQMLALHKSQREWLDVSQGVGSYVQSMEDMCRQVGDMSGHYRFAEGWTRHLHLGYCGEGTDPLSDALVDQVCWGEPSMP